MLTEALSEQVEKGLNKKAVYSAINNFEFQVPGGQLRTLSEGTDLRIELFEYMAV